MKKKLAAFLAMMMALVTMSSAAMAEEETPTITAHKANAITIDGDLSDWDLSSPAVLEDASQIIRDLSFWQGPNDLSAKVYAAYDEENLYLAFDVTEDTPYGAIEMLPLDGEDNLKVFISTDPTDDPNRTEYHTNDFLLFLICDNNYFDTAFDRTMVAKEYRQRFIDTAFDRTMVAKEYRQRFISKGIDGGEDVLTEGYERATQATSTGFIFEVKIAWANFANNKIAVYQPQSGDVVKFNVAVTDISYPCPGTEYIPQMAWTGTIEINTNPSLWGNLVFE